MQKRQTDYVRVQLRMPPELHERLTDFASKNDYSLNSAINTTIDTGLDNLAPIEKPDSQVLAISGMKKELPVRTQIRLPPELHAELVKEAEKNSASLNDVMVYHLLHRHDKLTSERASIPLPDYMAQQIQKIIEGHLANAEKHFQQAVNEKIDLIKGLTAEEIHLFFSEKMKQ